MKPHAIFGKKNSKTKRGPLKHEGNPGIVRSKCSTEFLLAANPRLRLCERTQPYRLRKVRKTINEKGLVPGGFGQSKGRQAVHFTLASPLHRNPIKKHKSYKYGTEISSHFGSSNMVSTLYACGCGGAPGLVSKLATKLHMLKVGETQSVLRRVHRELVSWTRRHGAQKRHRAEDGGALPLLLRWRERGPGKGMKRLHFRGSSFHRVIRRFLVQAVTRSVERSSRTRTSN